MKAGKKNITKHIRMYALGIWGVLSLLYIAGEPIDEDMPFGAFCLLKIAGLGSFGLCCWVGRRLRRSGLLPVGNDKNCKM